MSDDQKGPPVVRGTILPPEKDPQYDTGRPMVASVFSRIRNQVLQKELAAISAKAQTWNGLITALRDGERLKLEYVQAVERSEHLEELRLLESAKVVAEIKSFFDGEKQREKVARIADVRLDAELIRAERDLEALKKQAEVQPEESGGSRKVRAVKRIRAERDEVIEILLDGRTEEEVSEEDRELISDVRLSADHEIKRFLEESRG